MTEACPACRPLEPGSRWKKTGALVGVFFFCPCHLPITIAGIMVALSASGIPIAASWGRPLLYGVFGLSFLFFIVVLLRMAARSRRQQLEQDEEHAAHVKPELGAPMK